MDYILRVFENGQFVNDYHSCVEFKRDHPEHPKHYQYQTSVNRIFSFLIALTLCFGLTLNRPEFSVLAFIGTIATFLSWIFIFSQYKLIIDLVKTLLDNVVKCFYFVFLVLCGLYLLICGYFNGEDL